VTTRLGKHQKRLLQYLADNPRFALGLHTHQTIRRAESLIRKGYLDESWRVTESGNQAIGMEVDL